MHELVTLVQWAFEGFWRFIGFAILIALATGAARAWTIAVFAAIVAKR